MQFIINALNINSNEFLAENAKIIYKSIDLYKKKYCIVQLIDLGLQSRVFYNKGKPGLEQWNQG